MSTWITKLNQLLGLSTGSEPAPTPFAGTSTKLTYPVLLAGGERKIVQVIDSELNLVTPPVVNTASYSGLQIVDANGGHYMVTECIPVETGGSRSRLHLKLTLLRRVDLDQTKRILKDIIKAPDSFWSRDTACAISTVEGFRSLEGLMAACRNSASWAYRRTEVQMRTSSAL